MVHISKKEVITIVLVVLIIVIFIGLSIVFGSGTTDGAVKTSDGKIRTAFDTCQVCNGSPKAYFEQSENTLQCQNCGNKFPMNRVEVEAGGCNPIPIFAKDKTVTDESITISYDTLKANTSLFPSNWRK